jgi:hypothetical protein
VRALPICVCLAVLGATDARAALSEEAAQRLTAALEQAGATAPPGAAPSQEVLRDLTDGSVTGEDWTAYFVEYFGSHAWTPGTSAFWQRALEAAGVERLGYVSGLCAAAAVQVHAPELVASGAPFRHDVLVLAFTWLEAIRSGLRPDDAAGVAEALAAALQGRTGGLVPVAGHPSVGDPRVAALGVQAALTYGDYAARAPQAPPLETVLGLAGAGLRFWQSHRMLLLDNNVLGTQHVASLDSLLRAVPRELHAIVALIVPEGTGINPAGHSLMVSTGQLAFIPAVPMNRLTVPSEFAPATTRPVAAEFTVQAAQELVRVIQSVQFLQRPELVVRRNAILASAGLRQEAYLRRYIPPSLFLAQPDTLLPANAYLYFIDSLAAFQTAYDLWSAAQHEAMDQFLLLADLLSGGTNRTFFFATSPAGEVVRSGAVLSRTYLTETAVPWQSLPGVVTGYVPVSVNYVTGIAFGGYDWVFDIGPRGIVSRAHQRRRVGP